MPPEESINSLSTVVVDIFYRTKSFSKSLLCSHARRLATNTQFSQTQPTQPTNDDVLRRNYTRSPSPALLLPARDKCNSLPLLHPRRPTYA